MKFLRVDMRERRSRFEPVPAVYEHQGGRGLTAAILLGETDPAADALGPHNKLIVAPGLLGGTGVSTAGRLSIGAKSPLTGGVKEANAGGTAGDTLARHGLKAIVVEGQADSDELYILHVSQERAELVPAGSAKGLGTYATAEWMWKAVRRRLHSPLHRTSGRVPPDRRRHRLHG